MLDKVNRVRESREFLRIFKTVKPIYSDHLVIRATRRQGGVSRFGFVISNKIDKRSSRRNGLKRRIRAVIEHNLSNIKPGFDVVIQVKMAFDYPYEYKQIELEVLEIIKKTGLL